VTFQARNGLCLTPLATCLHMVVLLHPLIFSFMLLSSEMPCLEVKMKEVRSIKNVTGCLIK
jgi:hypothetical protein